MRNKFAKNPLPTVLMTIFLDVLGVGILLPIIPQLLANPLSKYYLLPTGWDFKGGLILLGWLVAIYPLMQFLSTPILGQLSDRYGRKIVLSLSIVGTGIGYLMFAVGIITRNLPLLFASRILDGITGGNLSVAQAVIADVTPPKERTKNFAKIGAAFGVGFVMGPYIGAKLATPNLSIFGLFNTPHWFNPATPFYFTAALSFLNAALVIFLLSETNKNITRGLKVKLSRSLTNIVKAATYPGLRVIFPSVFLYWAGFSFFQTFFQVLLVNKLNFTPSNIGDYFAYIGIWIALTQGVITPLVAKRFRSYQVLRVSLFMTGVGLFGNLWAHNTTQLLLVTPLFAVFVGLTMANTLSLISGSADKKMQGEVLGINASVQALAQAIPAALTGYIAVIGISTPVLIGGFVAILGGVVFWVLYKPTDHVVHDDPGTPAMAH